PPSGEEMVRHLMDAYAYQDRETGHIVELHHRLLSNPYILRIPFEELFRRSVEVRLGTGVARALGPLDSAVYLCCHAALHGFGRLKWVADVARLFDSLDAAGISGVILHARQLGCERHVTVTLALLHRLGRHYPMPAGVKQERRLEGLLRSIEQAVRS